jgi:hypothetical protein
MQQTILLTVDCSMSEDLEQKLIEWVIIRLSDSYIMSPG